VGASGESRNQGTDVDLSTADVGNSSPIHLLLGDGGGHDCNGLLSVFCGYYKRTFV